MRGEASTVKEILPTTRPDVIYEVILTTKSREGTANAAPIGLRFIDDTLSSFSLIVYKGTRTHTNLQETRVGVANITRDPLPFIKYLSRNKQQYLRDEIEDGELVGAPRLKNAEAYIEFVVEDFLEDSMRSRFHCTVAKAYGGPGVVEPYSRATFALIELCVNVSKIDAYIEHGLDFSELAQGITYCIRVLRDSAGGAMAEEYVKVLLSSLPDRSSSLLKKHLSRSGINL